MGKNRLRPEEHQLNLVIKCRSCEDPQDLGTFPIGPCSKPWTTADHGAELNRTRRPGLLVCGRRAVIDSSDTDKASAQLAPGSS